jgi:amino acid transporter
MSSQRIAGIVLLVIGVALLIFGINATHSVTEQASNTFLGHFTQTTTWYIVGGIALGVLGLLMSFLGGSPGHQA